MKRPSKPKRRQRRTGMSPYQRHGKIEYQYSTAHRTWQRENAGPSATLRLP